MKPNENETIKKLLEQKEMQSISFELCGQKEPHLVKYDFQLELKPLFCTFKNGSIQPFLLPNFCFGPFLYQQPLLVQTCTEKQLSDDQLNEGSKLFFFFILFFLILFFFFNFILILIFF